MRAHDVQPIPPVISLPILLPILVPILVPILMAGGVAAQDPTRQHAAGQQAADQHPAGQRAAAVRERIRQLVARLADRKAAPRAIDELVRIGRPAVAALRRAAGSGTRIGATAGSRRALRALGRIGPGAARRCSDLIDGLATTPDEGYLALIHAVADLVPYSDLQGDPRLVERIVFNSEDKIRKFASGNDRQRFQYEFNRLQQRSQVDPRRGLRAMITELERNRTHRREVAAEVVGRLGPKATAAVPALVEAMRRGAPVVGQIGGFSVPKYRDGFPRAASAALVAIAPHDPRVAVAWAWHLQNSRDEKLRMTAALRIGSFGAKARAQLPALVAGLRDESSQVRYEVITALGMLGPAARDAIPALRKLATGTDKAGAARATAALKRIEKSL